MATENNSGESKTNEDESIQKFLKEAQAVMDHGEHNGHTFGLRHFIRNYNEIGFKLENMNFEILFDDTLFILIGAITYYTIYLCIRSSSSSNYVCLIEVIVKLVKQKCPSINYFDMFKSIIDGREDALENGNKIQNSNKNVVMMRTFIICQEIAVLLFNKNEIRNLIQSMESSNISSDRDKKVLEISKSMFEQILGIHPFQNRKNLFNTNNNKVQSRSNQSVYVRNTNNNSNNNKIKLKSNQKNEVQGTNVSNNNSSIKSGSNFMNNNIRQQMKDNNNNINIENDSKNSYNESSIRNKRNSVVSKQYKQRDSFGINFNLTTNHDEKGSKEISGQTIHTDYKTTQVYATPQNKNNGNNIIEQTPSINSSLNTANLEIESKMEENNSNLNMNTNITFLNSSSYIQTPTSQRPNNYNNNNNNNIFNYNGNLMNNLNNFNNVELLTVNSSEMKSIDTEEFSNNNKSRRFGNANSIKNVKNSTTVKTKRMNNNKKPNIDNTLFNTFYPQILQVKIVIIQVL